MKPEGRGNIFLTGFMGSGKTEVGRALARRLRRRFIDLDSRIERSAGRLIPQIFRRGEAEFRRLESRALRTVCRKRGLVVALGGGALRKAENRRLVSSSGALVSLKCDEAELWRRLKPRAASRPLLDGKRPRLRMKALLRARRGLYAGADLAVSTTRRTPARAASEIAGRLRR